MWVFIGILFRAKRSKIELEPEILVVSFGDELVQFVACAGARGRPVRRDPHVKKKKKRNACLAALWLCAASFLARAGVCVRCVCGWLGWLIELAWPVAGRFFILFPSSLVPFVQINLGHQNNSHKPCKIYNLPV
jgi:hypothetical protein